MIKYSTHITNEIWNMCLLHVGWPFLYKNSFMSSIREFIDEVLVHFGSCQTPIKDGLVKLEYKENAIERLVKELKDNYANWSEEGEKHRIG